MQMATRVLNTPTNIILMMDMLRDRDSRIQEFSTIFQIIISTCATIYEDLPLTSTHMKFQNLIPLNMKSLLPDRYSKEFTDVIGILKIRHGNTYAYKYNSLSSKWL